MTARLAALAALLPLPAIACEPPLRGEGVRTIAGSQVVVSWRAPTPLPLATFFSLEFAACARDGRRVDTPRIDATMPEHGHGMNYRPTVEALGDGRYRANGLLLHMPGRWQLSFTVGDETLRAVLMVD
jgi:hypothetical protein